MNKFLKLKSLLLRSKIFSKTLNLDNYVLQNILKIRHNRKPLIIGGAALGITIFGFGICQLSKVSYCNSIFDPFGWADDAKDQKKAEIVDIQATERPTEIKIENEQESSINNPSAVVYLNDSKDKVINGIPTEVPYLIVGAGVAGMSAARTIRANDPLAKILIINEECQSPGTHHETYPPYRRILLSKYIWRRNEENQKSLLDTSGDAKQSSFLFLEPDSFFVSPEKLHQCEFGAVSLLNGHRVIQVNPKESTVTLEFSNHKISYRACLLATGSKPKRLKHLEKSDGSNKDLYSSGQVSYFRSLNDFRNLADKITSLRSEKAPGRVLIIGSGLLGTELTSSLGRVAKDQGQLEIIEVFKEKSHLFHILPEPLSRYLYKVISKSRVKLIPESEVVSICSVEDGPDQGRLAVSIKHFNNSEKTGTNVEHVDHVVIAAGVEPDTSLSEQAQLETDCVHGGFLVNSELQAREGIYVAGDSCSFYDTNLGRRRVEHWNHSEESGNVAGHNMAAYVLKTNKTPTHPIDNSKVAYDVLKPRIYDFQSSFSFKLNIYNSLEALGLVDSGLETRTFIATDFFDDNLDPDETTEKVAVEKTGKEIGKHDPLDMPGVVFYLKDKRVVGVLLWNCDDDIVIESDFPSPLRSNVARKVLAEQRIMGSEQDLIGLAADFDLSFFVNSQLKFLNEYTKQRKEKEQADKDIQLS